MYENDRIWIAGNIENPCCLLLNQANRHGLITGASGTGKTVTLKVLAEGLSKAGVPVFMADVKGDVTGIAQAGADSERMQERIARFGIEGWTYEGCPCRFWEIAGVGSGSSGAQGGIPIRVTVSQMGPTLLSRLLDLNEVQSGVLDIAFRVADDQRLLLIDLKDLRAMLAYLAEHSKEYVTTYGNVSSASVGAIQRALISVEDQGGDLFFGEPEVDLADWFACDESGHGYVNVLNAERLVQSPEIYSMFLLWMLSDLFEKLPEVGDLDKPKLAFFFDEAHLLFKGMPKELLAKIVQVVKLVRSKGVGVYFISQSPSDIPDEVLAQLSNRVQHGLRAYTPAEQKAVRAAAESFRANPKFDTARAIGELGTGEALVSFLDEEGRPSVVERARVLPPQCLMAAADAETIAACLAEQADLNEKYANAIDRQSAYEDINGIVAPDGGATASEPAESTASLNTWTCTCGAENAGKFCTECGAARPRVEGEEWTCNCGTLNTGKFCSNCGQPYEAGILTKEQKKAAEAEAKAKQKAEERERAAQEKLEAKNATERFKAEQAEKRAREKELAAEKKALKKAAGNIATSAGRTATNSIIRGILKNLF